jgi:UDP-2,3-diacylglucosamine hydrolase
MVFGHRHLPVDMPVAPVAAGSASRDLAATDGARYINLGDWITYFTYAVFDGDELKLMKRTSDGPLSGDVRITGGPAV